MFEKKNTQEKKKFLLERKNKNQKNINDIGGGNNRLGRYRIPKKIIEELFKNCI